MLSILLSNGKSHRRQRVCELQHRVRVVWAVPRPNSRSIIFVGHVSIGSTE